MTRRWTKAGLLCGVVVLAMEGADIYIQTQTNQAGKSPWGPDDQIGSLNMMTEESRLALLRQISTGNVPARAPFGCREAAIKIFRSDRFSN